MVLSKQLQHIHCGGELSSLAKLAIFVPLSLAIERKHSAVAQPCVLGIFLLCSQLADVRLFARKQTNPHKKSAEVGQRELIHEYDREASLL